MTSAEGAVPPMDRWSLYDALVTIRRRIVLIGLTSVAFALIGGLVGFLLPTRYEAEALLVQYSRQEEPAGASEGFVKPAERIAPPRLDLDAYEAVATSPFVVTQVLEKVGGPADMTPARFKSLLRARTEQRRGGNRDYVPVIWLSARGASPQEAVRRANAWAETLQAASRNLISADLDRVSVAFDEQFAAIEGKLRQARADLFELQREAELQTKRQELKVTRTQYEQYATQLTSFRLMKQIVDNHLQACAQPAEGIELHGQELAANLGARRQAAVTRSGVLEERLREWELPFGFGSLSWLSPAWNDLRRRLEEALLDQRTLREAERLLERVRSAEADPQGKSEAAQALIATLGTYQTPRQPAPWVASYLAPGGSITEMSVQLPPSFPSEWLATRDPSNLVVERWSAAAVCEELRLQLEEMRGRMLELESWIDDYTTRVDIAQRSYDGVRSTFESLVARSEQARSARVGEGYGLMIASRADDSARVVSLRPTHVFLAGAAAGFVLAVSWTLLRERAKREYAFA